jgi:hypothetical protein
VWPTHHNNRLWIETISADLKFLDLAEIPTTAAYIQLWFVQSLSISFPINPSDYLDNYQNQHLPDSLLQEPHFREVKNQHCKLNTPIGVFPYLSTQIT